MTLTWRQLVAYFQIAGKFNRHDQANDLLNVAYGSAGDPEALKQRLLELSP